MGFRLIRTSPLERLSAHPTVILERPRPSGISVELQPHE
jgi:hypothetical protein